MSTQAVRSTQPYHTTTSFFCIVVARQENGLTSQSGPEWALLPPVFLCVRVRDTYVFFCVQCLSLRQSKYVLNCVSISVRKVSVDVKSVLSPTSH